MSELFSWAFLNTARRFAQAKISVGSFTFHRYSKCVTGCPGAYIAVVLFVQSVFCLQLTMEHKYTVFRSQHYDRK